MPIPELLLPAGGFDSAIAAIEGGADALYLGFAELSARKGARNFDALEYRRLYRYAREKGIRLYVTLNTIVLQDELEGAASLLAFLGRFPPDAVLVQDWGLAALIRMRHPGIAIHASTQAAVQGSAAARIARELGATRIVLPRETSLAEMARIHDEEPGIEYEAFVHGALCYSFSGLCLASGLVLGRSGNRGQCAQLCRSYYDADGGGLSGRRGYWFSCRDLELGGRVGELAAAGISSLKVEGRMKGPEYCYAVARLYRGLLDALKGEGPDMPELEKRLTAARTAFSRTPSEAWLLERGGASLIDSGYPGHRGVSAGRVLRVAGSLLSLDLSSDLSLRDGLLGFEGRDQSRPIRFPVLGLREPSGREIIHAKSGTIAQVEVHLEGERVPELAPGDEIFRISARELDRKTPSPEEYEAEREDLGLRLRISTAGIGAELSMPRFDGLAGSAPGAMARTESIREGESVPMDKAKVAGGFERALSLFGESGDADFRLVPSVESEAVAELFVPPSALKREKNRIYAEAAALVEGAGISYALDSLSALGEAARASLSSPMAFEAPPRAALVFHRDQLASGMPFAMRRDLIEGADLPTWGARSWLPLAPLVADRDEYASLVRDRVRLLINGVGSRIVVGLGALHHFALARELLSDNPGAGERLAFFLDFNLYVANEPAYASLSTLLPRIEFAYRYIEAPRSSSALADGRIVDIGPGFEPPLFQSLGCLLKHHVLGGSCPESCERAWSTVFLDRDRRYAAVVEDCVSMLFRTN